MKTRDQRLEYASALSGAALKTKLPFTTLVDLAGPSKDHHIRLRLFDVLSARSSEREVCVFFDRPGWPLPTLEFSIERINEVAWQIKTAQCNETVARRLLLLWRGDHPCPDDDRILVCVEVAFLTGRAEYRHFNEKLARERTGIANSLIATLRTGERPLSAPDGPVWPVIVDPDSRKPCANR